jgi:hypothetical protein
MLSTFCRATYKFSNPPVFFYFSFDTTNLLGERIQLAREARSRLLSLSHHSSLKNSFDINTFLTGIRHPQRLILILKGQSLKKVYCIVFDCVFKSLS